MSTPLGRDPRGFTLVEILIASTIFALILLGVYVVYETNQGTYVRGEARSNVQQNVRVALDQITRELLMAGDDPGNCKNASDRATLTRTPVLSQPSTFSTGSLTISNYPIQAMASSSVRFLADVNADSNIDGGSPPNYRHTEVVQFAYDASNRTITRQVWTWSAAAGNWTTGGAQAITENGSIQSLTFTYRDENNAITANAYAVRRIEVTISARVSAGSQGTQSFSVSSDIRPRNL
jgi:prepilin-type N-terminal cleavage/methylation domain-containing protein